METDTLNRYDHFNQTNYDQQQPDQYAQQSKGQSNQTAISQPLYYSNDKTINPNSQINNQSWPGQINNSNQALYGYPNQAAIGYPNQVPVGYPNQVPNYSKPKPQITMNPRDSKLLNDCSRQGFYMLTLPSIAGFLLYKQYSSLKNLKPLTFTAIGINSAIVYLISKIIWAPVCFNRLKRSNPELFNQFKNRNQNLGNNNYYGTIPVNQPPNYKLSNSPYLSPSFKQQPQNKEYDDNYDASNIGYDKSFK